MLNIVKIIFNYIKVNRIWVIIPAALCGAVTAVAVSSGIAGYVKSNNLSGDFSDFSSSSSIYSSSEETVPAMESVITETPVQPIEKKVEYKGKSINVPKVEVAAPASKEDSENGSYKVEQTQEKAQPAQNTGGTNSASKIIPYKVPSESFSGGIDVSSHNKVIDWAAVKASGVQFAMIRCGYRGYLTGKIVMDASFEYNIENAYKNGINVGVYFYSTAISETEALEEAAYVVELIKAQKAKGISLSYPVAYDYEEFYNNDSRTRAKNQSGEQISKNTAAFLDYIKSSGYKPMLYAGKNPVKKYWDPAVVSKYDFWLAHYTEATEYTGKFYMWQYTSSGKVSGIEGRVDLNICGFGDNLPRFMICKNAGEIALTKPDISAAAALTLQNDTVYLCRHTYDPDFTELKIDGKYYYLPTSKLSEIPFENAKDGVVYKTIQDTAVYSKPFDDSYKTGIILSAGKELSVLGIWQDKWVKIEYENKTYYIKNENINAENLEPEVTEPVEEEPQESQETDQNNTSE